MRYLCCKQGNFINRTKGEHESLTVETLKPGEEIFFAHLQLLHVKGCASGTPCIYYTSSLLSACLHRSPLLHFCFLCIDFFYHRSLFVFICLFLPSSFKQRFFVWNFQKDENDDNRNAWTENTTASVNSPLLSIPPFSKVDDKFKRIILQNELQKIRQTFRQVMQSKNDSKKLQICCSNAFQQFSETTACVLLKKKLLCKFLLFCHISLRSVTQLVCCRNRGVLQKKN